MDTIGPGFGVVLMMNNYFHDVATGLLAASGFSLWLMARRFSDSGSREETEYFLRIHAGMTKLAKFSFWWIILAGVPRTIFYKSFEWANAVEKAQVPAIIVKHVLVFAFVGTGIYLWHKLNKRAKLIRESLGSG
jgi:hypothetical protein